MIKYFVKCDQMMSSGLSLKNRIFENVGKIMEKGDDNGTALPFICKMWVKD